MKPAARWVSKDERMRRPTSNWVASAAAEEAKALMRATEEMETGFMANEWRR